MEHKRPIVPGQNGNAPSTALSRSSGPGIGNNRRSLSLSRPEHHMVRPPLVIPLAGFSFSKRKNCSVRAHALALSRLDHPQSRGAVSYPASAVRPGYVDNRTLIPPRVPILPQDGPSRFDAGYCPRTDAGRKRYKWGQNALLTHPKLRSIRRYGAILTPPLLYGMPHWRKINVNHG